MSKVINNPIVGIIGGAATTVAGIMTGQPALIGIGVSMGLGSVSNMLAPSARMPSRARQVAQTSPLRGRTLNIRESDSPQRLIYGQARVGGNLVFAHVTGNDKEYLHLIYVLAGHPVSSIGATYRDGKMIMDANGVITDPAYEGLFTRQRSFGSDTNPTIFTTLASAAPNKWTDDHRLYGLAAVSLRLKWDAKAFINGAGNFTHDVAGAKSIFDPRTGLWGYSRNPALCIADYLTNTRYGLGFSRDDIDEADLIASANICDEAVPEDESEARYRCDGVVTLDQDPASILAQLVGSMAGTVIPVGPKWRILAGVWTEPTLTLNENHLRGGIAGTTRRPGRELFNQVRGLYIGPDTKWQPSDYKAVKYAGWIEEDNGIEKIADLDLPFTTDHRTARRIAKIELSRNRRQIMVKWPGNLSCLRLRPGDTVNVSLERMGWAGKSFLIENSRLSTDDKGLLVVDLSLAETDANVYEWEATETRPPEAADETDLPEPGSVRSPNSCTLTSGPDTSYKRIDGTWFSRLQVSWPLPRDIFVQNGGQIQIQYKRTSAPKWLAAGFAPGDSTEAYILDVEDGQKYVARIRSVSVLGHKGEWVQSEDHTVVGKQEAGLNVEEFQIERLPDGTRRFTWDIGKVPTDLAGYRIYYGSGTSLPFDQLTPLHAGLLTSSPWETNELSAGTYTFAIVAVDRSENISAAPRIIQATIGDPRMRNVLLARDERALHWPGTLTDCAIVPSWRLEALSAGDWSTLPATWDALGLSWRKIQTNRTPITYTTPQINIGFPASFTPRVSAEVLDAAPVTTEMRVAAVPLTNEPWQALAFVQNVRYIQLRITVGGTYPFIMNLTTHLDAEMTEDLYEDIDLAAATMPAGVEKIATGHFKVATRGRISRITQAQISSIQNVVYPRTWLLVSKTTTLNGYPAAEFNVYNQAGELSNATVDVLLKGIVA